MRKMTFFASFLFAGIVSSAAAEITINPGDSLNVAIANAQEGDTIFMNDGDYSYESKYTIYLDKSLTIKAVNPGSAIVNFVCFEVEEGASVNHIVMDGVVAEHDYTSGNYFLQVNKANLSVEKVELRNLKVSGYGRGVLRSTESTCTIDTILVDNCIFERNSEENAGYGTINPQKAKCKYIAISNSTFYNQPSGILRAEGSSALNLQVSNCTVLKCGSAEGSQNMISAKGVVAGTKVKDCIFSGAYVDESALLDKSINLNSNENALVDNCLLEGYSTVLTKGTAVENQVEAMVASYDFETLTLTTNPNTVTGIGDPRWNLNDNTASSVETVTDANKEVKAVEYYDVNGRLIDADNYKGMLIRRTVYTDGTCSAAKLVK